MRIILYTRPYYELFFFLTTIMGATTGFYGTMDFSKDRDRSGLLDCVSHQYIHIRTHHTRVITKLSEIIRFILL